MELRKHKPVIVLIVYMIISGLSYIDGFEDKAYAVLSQLEVTLLCILAYTLSEKNYILRSVLYSLSIYNGYILLTDWLLPHVSITQWAIELIVFTLLALFQLLKTYALHTDKYNNKNILLVFYKPKNPMEYLTTMFGLTVSSMSVIHGTAWYLFRRNSASLQKVKVVERHLNDYIIIDTGIPVSKHKEAQLDALVGTKARQFKTLFIRCNCIQVFSEFLQGLGEYWKPRHLDWIPSIYLFKRFKNRD